MGAPEQREPGSVSLPLFDGSTGMPFDIEVGYVVHEGRRLIDAESLAVALGGILAPKPKEIKFDCGLVINQEQRLVSINGEPIPEELTKTEYPILEAFALRPRRVHSREDILKYGWGKSEDFYSVNSDDVANMISVNVKRLRSKLGAAEGSRSWSSRTTAGQAGPNAGLIRTYRGFGYGMGDRAFSAVPLAYPGHLESRAS
ncbi:hypothetical protein BH10PAT3_BH10PAT3_4370 [soil metagenome]